MNGIVYINGINNCAKFLANDTNFFSIAVTGVNTTQLAIEFDKNVNYALLTYYFPLFYVNMNQEIIKNLLIYGSFVHALFYVHNCLHSNFQVINYSF